MIYSMSYKKYEILTDAAGRNYIGLNIAWYYHHGYVDISMPKYIMKALQKFCHTSPDRRQRAPHTWTEPVYSQQTQYILYSSTLRILDKQSTTRI